MTRVKKSKDLIQANDVAVASVKPSGDLPKDVEVESKKYLDILNNYKVAEKGRYWKDGKEIICIKKKKKTS